LTGLWSGIDDCHHIRRFFERALHNYWDPDAPPAIISVRITEIFRETAPYCAGMLSAQGFFARFAVLTDVDGYFGS
jgi:hypothetical protein